MWRTGADLCVVPGLVNTLKTSHIRVPGVSKARMSLHKYRYQSPYLMRAGTFFCLTRSLKSRRCRKIYVRTGIVVAPLVQQNAFSTTCRPMAKNEYDTHFRGLPTCQCSNWFHSERLPNCSIYFIMVLEYGFTFRLCISLFSFIGRGRYDCWWVQ